MYMNNWSKSSYNILLVPWLHVDKKQLILFVEINTVPQVLLIPSFFYVVPSKSKYMKSTCVYITSMKSRLLNKVP